MCEIFGFSADKKHYLNTNLQTFYSHSDKHPHGWGLAYLQDDEIQIQKEAIKATDSHYLSEILSSPIETNIALAHIRFATVGNIYRKNCHPYRAKDNFNRYWTLIHNGTIFEYKPLNKYTSMQKGETDSERILLHFVDKINKVQNKKGLPLTFKERFDLLNKMICEMSFGNKLNLIFYDGEYMYVHTNYEKSLYYLELNASITISTQPLNCYDWQGVPLNTLLAVKNGAFAAKGLTHGNEYIDNEEAYKNLFLDFSNL